MDKKLKIAIIYSPTNLKLWYYVPEGMARLSAYLKQRGFDVKQINLDIKCLYYNLINKDKIEANIFSEENFHDYMQTGTGPISLSIDKMLNLFNIDGVGLICFSLMYLPQLYLALCLAKKIKERTSAKIIFGGAFISRHVTSFLRNYNFIDFIIQGSGEISLSILAEMIDKDKINEKEVPGLVYRKGGDIRINSKKICLLEELPTPDYDGTIKEYLYTNRIKNNKKKIFIAYQISRGCTHKCRFCDHALFETIEFRSPEKIVSDLKEITLKYGVKKFWFGCNSLNLNKKHMINICKAIIHSDIDIKWVSFARPQNIDFETLLLLKKAGCEKLNYGIETGSQRLLDYLNKNLSISEMEKTLKDTKKADIHTMVNLILDIPTETRQDIEQTANFIKRNAENIDTLIFHKFLYLPHTSIFQTDGGTQKGGAYIKPSKNVNEIKKLFNIARKIKNIQLVGNFNEFFNDDHYNYWMC
ncbi:MAG: B12-binding domain-containing radical SAM protein [Candidatus Thorarchaeota archaeon]